MENFIYFLLTILFVCVLISAYILHLREERNKYLFRYIDISAQVKDIKHLKEFRIGYDCGFFNTLVNNNKFGKCYYGHNTSQHFIWKSGYTLGKEDALLSVDK